MAVKGVDLEVRAGEIVAIAGVQGNGQTELVEAITGPPNDRLRARSRSAGKHIEQVEPRARSRTSASPTSRRTAVATG